MNRTLSTWQVEEIRRAIEEADRGEFASEQEAQRVLQNGLPTSNLT